MLTHFSAFSNELEFSGYARVIGGYLDEKNVEFKGFEDSIKFSPSSLIGLQGEYQFDDKWSATAQFLLRSNNTTASDNSGLEWLYLTYTPTDNIQIKHGKLRTPFFTMSDFSDVGFEYPWINQPQQVYDTYLFKTFNGIDAVYKFGAENFDLSFEGYYGEESGDIGIGALRTGFEVDNLLGFIGKINIENLEFRVSRYNGNIKLDIDEIRQLENVLNSLNFTKSARSVKTKGRAYADQFGVIYENLDYFFRGEWIRIKTDLGIVPTIQSYYLTAGITYAPFTYHLTFADSDVETRSAENEIPLGINSDLDELAYGYNRIFDESTPDSIKSWTVVVRWDVLTNLALKAEFSTLEGDDVKDSFFVIPDDSDIDKKTNLYLIGLDWVF
jgi:hypothetical protein